MNYSYQYKYTYKYNKYKTLYLQLKNQTKMIQDGGNYHNNYDNNNNKYSLYTTKEKEDIMTNYNKIINKNLGDICNFSNILKNNIKAASKGIYIGNKCDNQSDNETIKELYDSLIEVHEDKHKLIKDKPFIKDDSLTTWCNMATELYGLKIKDILKLKKGDKIDVVLMDRNVGDYMDGEVKRGQKYNPLKGVSKGKYIHDKGLHGVLKFDFGETLENFEWELNMGSLGSNWYWGPYNSCSTECKKDKTAKKSGQICTQKCTPITDAQLEKINKDILVGWRGPAILKSDAKKLPKKVTHYDTWYDDYAPYKYHDWLNKK